MKAVEFCHVGKQYRLGRVGTGTLSHDLNRWWQTTILRREDPYLRIGETNDRTTRGTSDYVWALRDVTFQVAQGEVVGIIGRNGAGTSTLLKLLSGITAPSTGQISYHGRVASLLEIGTGFHPEMTGRENIYMNGAILGMTRHEITHKLDEIIDFAGIERYIDTPVKRYSSGMTVRLGFAVAAFLEPEILVVDEVLAVGDAEFQKKAIGKMQDVSRSGGRTVLFVSHNMATIKGICNRGVVLKNGLLDYDGTAVEAVTHYMSFVDTPKEGKITDYIDFLHPGIRVSRIEINGTEASSSTIVTNQKELQIAFEGDSEITFSANLQLKFFSMEGMPMATYSEGAYKGIIETIQPGHFLMERTIALPRYLSMGDYELEFEVNKHSIDGSNIQRYLWAKRCATIHVEGSMDEYGHPLQTKWEGFLGL